MQPNKFISFLIAMAMLLAFPLAANAGAAGTVQLSPSYVPTYAASSPAFTSPTSATDFADCFGSAGHVIQIYKIYVSQIAVTAGQNNFYLIKRSTANSGGTSSTITSVPLNSTSGAGAATVHTYTGSPSLGGTVGQVSEAGITAGGSTTSTGALTVCLYDADKYGQAITLNSASEGVGINNNGVTNPISQSVSVTFVYGQPK